MAKFQFFEDLSNKISDMVSNSPANDVRSNVNALLQGAFTKMELVSREEFDAQAEVLRLTREKLNFLENKLTMLESELQKNNN